jgi:osmotically-inducible protein OsmY
MTVQSTFSETTAPAALRADVDIAEDIGSVIRSYPPLRASRPFVRYTVSNGKVTFSGNVRSPQARRYLLDHVPHILGVTSVNADNLRDDDMLLVAIGERLPDGVYATELDGAIALTGMLPRDMSAQALVETVKALPGVRYVTATFDNAPLNTPGN